MNQKKIILLMFFIGIRLSVLYAEKDFHAPVLQGGKEIVSPTPNTVSIEYTTVSHSQIIDFYEKSLKDESDINWKEPKPGTEMVIHDWGNREWHNIKITTLNNRSVVEIKKDNWTWIVGTLIIRFVGVFIVLIILMISIIISGKIFATANINQKAKKV